MAGLGPYAPVLPNPTVGLLDFLGINDPWMRRLADLECYLLSGVDASGTVAAEFAAVFGASDDLKQSEVRSIHWSPIRPRWRGERRFLRTFAVVSLRPSLAFNTRPRCL